MSSTPSSTHSGRPSRRDEPARIGVLERNRLLGQRIGRVARAALRLATVAVEDEPASLRSALGPEPTLLLCDAADLDLALEWAHHLYPTMSVAAWTTGEMDPAARRGPTRQQARGDARRAAVRLHAAPVGARVHRSPHHQGR